MDAITCKCPMCGAPVARKLGWNLSSRTFETSRGTIIFSETQARIFNAFWLKKPLNTIRDLADYVYATDPNGGPDCVGPTLSITIGRMREKLNDVGYSITYNGAHHTGWRIFKIGEAA